MKDANPASQLADKLSCLDRAVWGRLPRAIHKAVADYREADQKAQQKIVNKLHKGIEKHGETLQKLYFGRLQELAMLDLRWDNRTTVQKDLEDWLRTVLDEFHRHFPQDEDELARRLGSGKFFQTGQDWWLSRVLIRKTITLLRYIAEKQGKGGQDRNDYYREIDSRTREQAWRDEAPEYISNADAVRMADDKISLPNLSKLLRKRGNIIRWMRNRETRRSKVNIQDFRKYMKKLKSSDEFSEAAFKQQERRKAIDQQKRSTSK